MARLVEIASIGRQRRPILGDDSCSRRAREARDELPPGIGGGYVFGRVCVLGGYDYARVSQPSLHITHEQAIL